jgi:hypothetical protein
VTAVDRWSQAAARVELVGMTGVVPSRGERIVVILPRGEAIRNFVYSGMIDELRHRLPVSVLSVVPSDDMRALLEAECGPIQELKETEQRWAVGFLAEILDMAHGRWLWSEAAKERWRLRDTEAPAGAALVKRKIKKALCLPFANRSGLQFLSGALDLGGRLFRTTKDWERFLKDLGATLVFNGSHVHSHLAVPVVDAARRLQIPTAAFIFSWDNLTSQGRIAPAYDYYLVWNESLKAQLLQIYGRVRADQVFVTGTPQFDFHARPESYMTREEFCARVGADPSRPIVLYTTGMANHMPGEPQIVEGIAAMLREMLEFGPPQLLVRVYPKDRTGRFEELKRRDPTILFPEVPWEPAHLTPLPEDGPLLTNMLRHAAVGINVASTVSLELCMFEKPVVNVAYDPPGLNIRAVSYARYYEFDHYRPVVQSGAVSVAHSESEMRSLVRRALADPRAGSDQRRALLTRMFANTLDGRSGERVAERLIALAGRVDSR